MATQVLAASSPNSHYEFLWPDGEKHCLEATSIATQNIKISHQSPIYRTTSLQELLNEVNLRQKCQEYFKLRTKNICSAPECLSNLYRKLESRRRVKFNESVSVVRYRKTEVRIYSDFSLLFAKILRQVFYTRRERIFSLAAVGRASRSGLRKINCFKKKEDLLPCGCPKPKDYDKKMKQLKKLNKANNKRQLDASVQLKANHLLKCSTCQRLQGLENKNHDFPTKIVSTNLENSEL